jgi:hypothetical protein
MSAKQSAAARKNIKKAANAARKKRTIAHLPKSVRTALGKKARLAQSASAQRDDRFRFNSQRQISSTVYLARLVQQ